MNKKTVMSAGERFGRLVIVGASESHPTRKTTFFKCKCDCGELRTVSSVSLRSGHTKSCGCLGAENRRKAATKHGNTVMKGRTTEYSTWQGMKARCNIPSHIAYKNYGGRGIKVCERWNDFVNFLADMGMRPSASHSLDRIDPNKGYSPENCRWATRSEQNKNRREKIFSDNIICPHCGEKFNGHDN